MRQIVVMVDRSAGNNTVGEMWIDTFLFDENKTIKEVLDKIYPDYRTSLPNTRIQIAQED